MHNTTCANHDNRKYNLHLHFLNSRDISQHTTAGQNFTL